MADEKRFEFESMVDPDTIRSFLESLIDGFERATIYLSSEDSEITLHPEGLLKFQVKAKRKRAEENQLMLKVSWKEQKQETSGKNKTIRISSDT